MEQTKEEARIAGYVVTPFGRRCWIAGIADKNPARRGYAERQAINAPLQGGAADIIKRAMVRLPAALRAAGLKARMLLQVHDELLFEAPEGEAPRRPPIWPGEVMEGRRAACGAAGGGDRAGTHLGGSALNMVLTRPTSVRSPNFRLKFAPMDTIFRGDLLSPAAGRVPGRTACWSITACCASCGPTWRRWCRAGSIAAIIRRRGGSPRRRAGTGCAG